MGVKRPRSCKDNNERKCDLKKPRRIASASPIGAGGIPPGLDVTASPRQYGGLENENPHVKAEDHKLETSSTTIISWIQDLPKANTEFHSHVIAQTPFKRTRSNSDTSLPSSDVDSDNETRRSSGDLYKDPRYDALMESLGVFTVNSETGPCPKEIDYCKSLFGDYDASENKNENELRDPIFDGNFLEGFAQLMERSSELRLCIDLHARLVPSAELLSLQQGKVSDLREGCNDRWLQALRFGTLPKLPQPDRTVAFRASLFTDEERSKLRVKPGVKSLFAACEGMLFPFITCEVKAELEGLATARRANANSMAIALRGVVDLFRQAKVEQDIHRKILGISLAHNASTVHIYGHFPELDGEKTNFYRYKLRTFDYTDRDGADRYTCYKFVRNVYAKFATRHLKRLREAIAKLDLPQPTSDASEPEQKVEFLVPAASDAGTNISVGLAGQKLTQKQQIAQLIQMVAGLRKELERTRHDAKEREATLMKLLQQRLNST